VGAADLTLPPDVRTRLDAAPDASRTDSSSMDCRAFRMRPGRAHIAHWRISGDFVATSRQSTLDGQSTPTDQLDQWVVMATIAGRATIQRSIGQRSTLEDLEWQIGALRSSSGWTARV
jgi:hypothetical protein